MNTSRVSLELKSALSSGILNLCINGLIQYFTLKSHEEIALSLDSISSKEVTVLGSAITLGISLSIVLTIIEYFKIKGDKVTLFPNALLLVAKHAFFAFATLTAVTVAWQRIVGTIFVGLFPAILIIGITAGGVSAIITYITILKCSKR
jgi:hypothetical protein